MSNPQKARVGDSVYYFPNAVDQVPRVGLVTDVYSADMVSLAVWEAGRFVQKQSVHNRNSQVVKDNQTISMKFGIWDFRDPPEVRDAINELVYGAAPSKTASAKQTAKV